MSSFAPRMALRYRPVVGTAVARGGRLVAVISPLARPGANAAQHRLYVAFDDGRRWHVHHVEAPEPGLSLHSPAWRKDGAALAVVAEGPGTPGIVAVASRGRSATNWHWAWMGSMKTYRAATAPCWDAKGRLWWLGVESATGVRRVFRAEDDHARAVVPVSPRDAWIADFAVACDGRPLAWLVLPHEPAALRGERCPALWVGREKGAMRRVDMGLRPVGYLAWSPSGRRLAVVARDERRRLGRAKLVVVSAERVGPTTWVEVSEEVEGWLTGYDWVSEEEGIVAAFDRSTAGILVHLRLSGDAEVLGLSGDYLSGPHVDRATHRLFFLRQGLARPQEQCVAEWPWKRARVVVNLNRAVRHHVRAEGRVVTWVGRDGMTLSGIVLETPHRRRGVLVWLHGGPAEHIGATFSPYFHVFCGAGFDVFAPNYRGSTGRDEAFVRASCGRLGRDDAGDVECGVTAVFGRDVLAGRRTVLAGWSYGGTLALRLVGRGFPAACVVVGAPITDFTSLGGAWRMPHVLGEYLGAFPWLDRTAADRVSPLTWLDAIHCPVLILHGQHDGVVPVSQGRLLYRALKARGVPVDLVVYPGEGHVMASPRAVEDMLRRIIGWGLDHLPESR